MHKDSQPKRSKYTTELFSRTDLIINQIFGKLSENFHEEPWDIIIDRGINPAHFVLSKLVIENSSTNKVRIHL